MFAPTGIAYASADGSIQSVNPAFAAMLGYSSDNRSCLVVRFHLGCDASEYASRGCNSQVVSWRTCLGFCACSVRVTGTRTR